MKGVSCIWNPDSDAIQGPPRLKRYRCLPHTKRTGVRRSRDHREHGHYD